MMQIKGELEKQDFKLFQVDTHNGNQVVFTIAVEGMAENETGLMKRSVATILKALSEDLRDDLESRHEIAMELLLQIADMASDSSKKRVNDYESLADKKAILVGLMNLL